MNPTSMTAALWIPILAPLGWVAMLVVLYRAALTERTAICPQRAARELLTHPAAGSTGTVAQGAVQLPRQSGRDTAADQVEAVAPRI